MSHTPTPWVQPKPRPSDAQCGVECGAEENWPEQISAGGCRCGGCGRRRPCVKYVRADAHADLVAENKKLRACWELAPDTRVIDSGPNELLIETKTGDRRRVSMACPEERDALRAACEALRESYCDLCRRNNMNPLAFGVVQAADAALAAGRGTR